VAGDAVSIKIAIICDKSRWSAILQRIGVFTATMSDPKK